jgi:hypothetical protein
LLVVQVYHIGYCSQPLHEGRKQSPQMTVLFKQSSFSVIFLFVSATGACFVHCPDEQRYQ